VTLALPGIALVDSRKSLSEAARPAANIDGDRRGCEQDPRRSRGVSSSSAAPAPLVDSIAEQEADHRLNGVEAVLFRDAPLPGSAAHLRTQDGHIRNERATSRDAISSTSHRRICRRKHRE
jgi:hypothetical protein